MKKRLFQVVAATTLTLMVSTMNAQPWDQAGNVITNASKLGSTNGVPLKIFTGNAERMRIDTFGRVSINYSSPLSSLAIVKKGSSLPGTVWVPTGSPVFTGFGENVAGNGDFILGMAGNAFNFRPTFFGRRARGTLNAPLVVQTGDQLASFMSSGYDGTVFQVPAGLEFFVDGAPTSGNVPTRISLVTGTNNATRAERLKVGYTGDFFFNNSQLTLQQSTGNLRLGKGNFIISNRLQSIQFPSIGGFSNPMINMFDSGALNWTRMVIAHSPALPNLGLQYNDSARQFRFVSDGKSVLTTDLFYKTVSIGTTDPSYSAQLNVINDPNSFSTIIQAINTNTTSGGGDVYGMAANAYMAPGWGVGAAGTGGYIGGSFYGTADNTDVFPLYGMTASTGGDATTQYSVYGGGNAFTTSTDVWAGYFNGNVYATGTYQGSDAKLKKNIKALDNATELINRLKPRTYEFRQDGNYKLMSLPAGKQYGLIAQDVEEVLPELTKETHFHTSSATPNDKEAKKNDEVIDFKAVNYIELIPILIKGMQEQQAEIESLKAQVKQLTANSSKAAPVSAITLSSAALEQNIPNPPANNATTISYNIPAGAAQAYITVTDMHGRKIKQVNIEQKGTGTLPLNTAGLAAGTYSYSLYVDGRIVETKQMLVSGK